MLSQISFNIRMALRNTGVLIWCLIFPLIMATIFMTMFQSMKESRGIGTIQVGIVSGDGWDQASGLRSVLEDLAEEDGSDEAPLLALAEYGSAEEADAAVLSGDVDAVLTFDGAGEPELRVSATSTGTTAQGILQTVIDRYLAGEQLASDLVEENPAALATPGTMEDLAQNLMGDQAGTTEVSVLREAPQELNRFYYALLGYSCIMCSDVAQILIDRTRAGVTPAGSRRQVSAFPPSRQLTCALIASWIIVMVCMLVSVLYFHFVAGVSFGGRLWLTPVACGACAVVSCALGAFIGSLPLIQPNVKSAITTIATLALSLPAGLFGTPALDLSNWLSHNVPWVQAINPAVQATETLFALTFYDSLGPFASAVGSLIAIAAVLGAGAWIFMRRQRYART